MAADEPKPTWTEQGVDSSLSGNARSAERVLKKVNREIREAMERKLSLPADPTRLLAVDDERAKETPADFQRRVTGKLREQWTQAASKEKS